MTSDGVPRNRAVATRADSSWASLLTHASYHLVLFLVIISYYALNLVLAIWLISLAIIHVRWMASGQASRMDVGLLNIPVTLLVTVLMAKLLPVLWTQLKGLLTDEHDSQDEAALYGITLKPARYPEFYAHVQAVARLVNSPVPNEIRVTPSPACHCLELRRFSILADRKLVLVLGMPHLCVLRQHELDVILAHELSHVRAGDTRLGVFVFRFLASLKRGLELMREGRWPWFNLAYPLSRLYQVLVRPLAAPLVRRQEMLADATSARAFGGDVAALTLLKEWQLGFQFDAAVGSYGAEGDADGWTSLFRSFRESWRDFSEEGRAYLLRRLEEEEQSSFWDSHPTTSARIAQMRHFPDAERIRPELARELFPDFERLERRMSRTFARQLVSDQLAEDLDDTSLRDDDSQLSSSDVTNLAVKPAPANDTLIADMEETVNSGKKGKNEVRAKVDGAASHK